MRSRVSYAQILGYVWQWFLQSGGWWDRHVHVLGRAYIFLSPHNNPVHIRQTCCISHVSELNGNPCCCSITCILLHAKSTCWVPLWVDNSCRWNQNLIAFWAFGAAQSACSVVEVVLSNAHVWCVRWLCKHMLALSWIPIGAWGKKTFAMDNQKLVLMLLLHGSATFCPSWWKMMLMRDKEFNRVLASADHAE